MSLTYQQLAETLRRKAYARTVDTLKLPYERKWGAKIAVVLKRAGSDVAAAFLRSGEAAARKQVGDSFRHPMSEVYQDLYEEIGNVFGKLALETFIGSSGKSLMSKAPLDYGPYGGYGADPWDLWNVRYSPEFLAWLKDVTASRVKGITSSTAATITKLVSGAALREGESNDKIAEKIRAAWSFSFDRATRIAQTEINSAQNAASHFAMAKFIDPKTLVKSWLATNDKRTRPSHMRASASQKDIPFEDPFTVGGAKLMHPGDPSLGAPGKEIIRCRCTTTFARNLNYKPGGGTVIQRPSQPPSPSLTPTPTQPPLKPSPPVMRPSSKPPLKISVASSSSVDKKLVTKLHDAFENASSLLVDAINATTSQLNALTYVDRTSHYSPGDKAIRVSTKAGSRLLKTLAHEYGHHMDSQSISSLTMTKISQLSRAEGGLRDGIADARAKLALLRGSGSEPGAWSKLKTQGTKFYHGSYKDLTVADILGTLSKGEIGGGHSVDYYRVSYNAADTEIMAHLVTYYSDLEKYSKQVGFMKSMFPSLIEDFEASLKFIAKSKVTP